MPDSPSFKNAVKAYSEKISIWRRTVILFHRYNHLDGIFEGPFKSAGYSHYYVEPKFYKLSDKDEYYTPDIVAWNNETKNALLLEITTNPSPEAKKKQLYKYRDDLEISNLSTYGGPNANSYDIILSHPKPYGEDSFEFCEILASDTFDVKHEDTLKDLKLANNLQCFKGKCLPKKAPEIGIAIVPEMQGRDEAIRVGLVAIIMSKLLGTKDAVDDEKKIVGFTAEEILDLALERFKDRITPAIKNNLLANVKNALDSLLDYLNNYIEYDNTTERYKPTKIGCRISQNYQSRSAVRNRIIKWVEQAPLSQTSEPITQLTLDEFIDSDNEETLKKLLNEL